MARLDRLAPVKEVAQIAAVIEREFSPRPLAAVEPINGEPATALDQLVAGVASGHATCRDLQLEHALVQDAAYQSLLKIPAPATTHNDRPRLRGAIQRGYAHSARAPCPSLHGRPVPGSGHQLLAARCQAGEPPVRPRRRSLTCGVPSSSSSLSLIRWRRATRSCGSSSSLDRR
jgi:hypothetical protein